MAGRTKTHIKKAERRLVNLRQINEADENDINKHLRKSNVIY